MRNQGNNNAATGSARRDVRRAALPVKASDQAVVALPVSTLTLKKRDDIVGGRS